MNISTNEESAMNISAYERSAAAFAACLREEERAESETDPDETTSLLPVAGKDLCTLVTCTPYGVNTQRILVTGTRTEYDDESDAADTADPSVANTARRHWYLLLIAALEAAVYLSLMKRSGWS